jgi:predicted aspartyl protease
LGLALLLILLPATVHADDQAAVLLSKHKAFVGWQLGDGTFNALRLERRFMDSKGTVLQTAIELRVGMLYRRDYASAQHPESTTSTGFTGKIFWDTSVNGFTAPILGRGANVLFALDALFSEGITELPATLSGTANVNGVSASILHVTTSGSTPMNIYVDPRTGAFLKAVVNPGEAGELTYTIHSYLDVAPGKKMIGSWSVGNSSAVYAYAKVERFSGTPDQLAADLHPPAPTAVWQFANASPFPIKVTDKRVYVDAAVNGVRGRFILDTGAAGITLTDEFANRAHVKTVSHSHAFGVGGETSTLVRRADTIQVGGNTLSNVIVNTINITMNDPAYHESPNGLLGFDFLGDAVVVLNTANQTMQILDPSQTPADASKGFVVTANFSNLIPTIPIRIDGRADVDALLDTGDEAYMIFSNGLRGIAMLARAQLMASGISGEEAMACGNLSSVSIGPITYENAPACRSASLSPGEAIVGFDFLRHFDYVFDYPQGHITMTQHQNDN